MPRFVGRAAPFLDRLNTYGADGWTGGGPVLDYSPRWPINSFRAIMFLRLLTCGVVCAVDGVGVGAVVGIAVDGFHVSLRGQLAIGSRLLHD